MSERYTRVFSLPANLYVTGSPVVISAGVLLKDSQTDTILAQLKFRSISGKAILGLRIRLRLFDNFGGAMETPVEHEYLDLRIMRNTEFGQKIPVPIPSARARMYEITGMAVVFEDRSVWTSSDIRWEPLGTPTRLQFPDPQLQKQYEINFGRSSTFKPLVVRDLWYCTCGALNRKGEDCHKCHNSLIALQSLDMAGLIAQKDARLAQEAAEIAARKAAQEAAAAAERQRLEAEAAAKRAKKEAEAAARKAAQEAAAAAKQEKEEAAAAAKRAKAEAAAAAKREKQEAAAAAKQEKEEAAAAAKRAKAEAVAAAKREKQEAAAAAKREKQEAAAAAKRAKAEAAANRKTSKAVKVTISLLCTASVLAVLAYFVAIPTYKYHKAVSLMESGDYVQAIAVFEALDSYRDSNQQLAFCNLEKSYLEATSLMESKDYGAALQILEQIAPHNDSDSLIETCKTELVVLKRNQAQKLQDSHLYKQAIAAYQEVAACGFYCQNKIRECEWSILTTYGTEPYVSTGTPTGNEANMQYTADASVLTVHSITAVALDNACVRFTIDCTPPESYEINYTGNTAPKNQQIDASYNSLGGYGSTRRTKEIPVTEKVFFYKQQTSIKAERQTFIFDVPQEYLKKMDSFTISLHRNYTNYPVEIVVQETY